MKSSVWLRISLGVAVVALIVWLVVNFTGPKPPSPTASSATPTSTARINEPPREEPPSNALPGGVPAPIRPAQSPSSPSPDSSENPPLARTVPAPAAPSAQPPLPKARPPGTLPPPAPPSAGPLTPEQAAAARMDLEGVRSMIRDFRSIAGENPVGTNAEIMRQLMGENKKNANLGPPEGLNLNSNGELVDRWGTPFFFHQLSKLDMEIRSAGPDRVMWTEDDLITK